MPLRFSRLCHFPLLRSTAVVLVTLVLSDLAFCGERVPVRNDQDAIQGTWRVVALESGGRQAPAEIVAVLKLVFKDDTLTFRPGEPGFTNYKFKLDPTTKPAGFVMTHADGTSKEAPAKGIYLLEGDRLKICLGTAGKTPTEFTAKARSGQSMYSLEREK